VQHGGFTPLYVAASNGHAAAIDRLVEAKCDVNQAAVRDLPGPAPLPPPTPLDSLTRTVYLRCARRWPPSLLASVPASRARRGGRRKVRAERSERRRLTAMSPLPLQNNTATPLGKAAAKGHVEAVRALLAAGADKRVRTKYGTALGQARKNVKDARKLQQLEAMRK
jgi:ankyrin repeat protein